MTEELRTKILKRIEYLEKEVEHGKSLTREAQFDRFWDGKLSAIDGLTGELRFLRSLLEVEND